jgi:predicted phosphodiesterase
MKTLKIQLMSDLHLDHSLLEGPSGEADILVLAGDTAAYTEYALEWIERRVPPNMQVLYVPGNHEYERSDILTRDEELKQLFEPLSNVKVLQNEVCEIDGVRFLGTTLWPSFSAFPELGLKSKILDAARTGIIDFSSIRIGDRAFQPEDAIALNKKACAFLEEELDKPYDGKTVVITHFLPSRQCVNVAYANNPLNPYMVGGTDALVEKADVWFHGHTHSTVERHIGKCLVRCNPRGYSRFFNLAENTRWEADTYLEVPKLMPKKSRSKIKPL